MEQVQQTPTMVDQGEAPARVTTMIDTSGPDGQIPIQDSVEMPPEEASYASADDEEYDEYGNKLNDAGSQVDMDEDGDETVVKRDFDLTG